MGTGQSSSYYRVAAAAFAAALLSTALHAQPAKPLSLEEALSIAQMRAPSLSAASYGAQASNYLATSASQLPDPVLRAGVDNLPINGPAPYSPYRNVLTTRLHALVQAYVSSAHRHLTRERTAILRTHPVRHRPPPPGGWPCLVRVWGGGRAASTTSIKRCLASWTDQLRRAMRHPILARFPS